MLRRPLYDGAHGANKEYTKLRLNLPAVPKLMVDSKHHQQSFLLAKAIPASPQLRFLRESFKRAPRSDDEPEVLMHSQPERELIDAYRELFKLTIMVLGL